MEEYRINLVCFSSSPTARVRDIWQWNYGQILRIDGLNLPEAVEVHFSLDETGGEAKRRIGVTKEGVTDVRIPDFIVEAERSTNYTAYAFIYVADREYGNTVKKIAMEITSRPRPEAFVKPCEKDLFDDAIEATRESLSGSREAAELSEAWAHGRDDHPDQAEDNARYYAEQAAELRKDTGEDRSEVERMKQAIEESQMQVGNNLTKTEEYKNQAKTAAENALLSENNAKASENASARSQAGAEAAENAAGQYASDALAQKNAVEQKIADFETIRVAAVNAVNAAGTTQKKAVEDAGTAKINEIKEAGTKQIGLVEQSGTEQTQAVTDEGSAQKQILINEGTAQKKAIEEYAKEVIDFREQVLANTAALGGFSFVCNPDDGGLDIVYTVSE